MANRQFQQFQNRLEKGVVVVHAHVAIGAAGAPTLQKWQPGARTYATAATGGFAGVKSITRTSTGLYQLTLQDTYQRCLGFKATFGIAGGTTAIAGVGLDNTTTAVNTASAPVVGFATMSSTATVADPDSGSTLDIEIYLQNSSAL